MKFSLILGTLGRVLELQRFLDALELQTYRDFELLVVDQNPDDRLVEILTRSGTRFPIIHLRSEPGLSRARNVGLQFAQGEIVGFPDDDCWYSPDLLEQVHNYFRLHSDADGLTGRCIDSMGRDSHGRWDTTSGLVTPFNVFKRCNSNTIFLRHLVIERVGNFDEQLGPGAQTPWGCGDDSDYILRTLTAGLRVFYSPAIEVYHDNPWTLLNRTDRARWLSYSRGFGRVLRKHHYPFWFAAYQVSRPLGGIFIALIGGRLRKVRYHALASAGRLGGWATPIIPQCSARSHWRNRLRYIADAPRVYRNWWLWPLPKLGFDIVLRKRDGLSYAVRAGTADLSVVNEASILNPYLGANRIRLASDAVVIDGGANIGDFTLQAAVRCPRGRVIAVEPVTEHVQALKRNIELNGVSNIEVLQLALGDEEGKSEIHLAGALSSGTFAELGSRSEMVRKTSLSRLMTELAIERLDLLKLDCEGAEWEILPGAADLFPRIRQICLEYHPVGVWTGDKLAAMLRAHGYEVTLVQGKWTGLLWAIRRGDDVGQSLVSNL